MIILHSFTDLNQVRIGKRKRIKKPVAVFVDGEFVNRQQSKYSRAQQLCRELRHEVIITKCFVKVFDDKRYLSTQEEVDKYTTLGFTIFTETTTKIVEPKNPFKRR